MVNNLSRLRVKQLWVILLITALGGILLISNTNNSTSGLSQSARAALGGGQVTLTVDASKQVGTFSDDMLGVGYANWEHSWGKPFLGTDQTNMVTEAMKVVRPGIVRYAGGNWTNGVGWTRIPQVRPNFVGDKPQPINIQNPWPNDNNSYTFHYGTDEIDALATYARSIGADVMIEVNVYNNNPQMWADMVKYTNVEKGYGFKYWEIGNENEATWNAYLSPTEYMSRFKAYKAAMQAVDPSIIVVGGGFSSAVEYSINQADNLVREMGEIAKVGDGITWHWYMEHDTTTIGNFMRYTNPDNSELWDNKYSGSRQWPDYIVPRINTEQIAGRNILHGVTEINTASLNRAHVQQNHIAALMLSDALPRLAVNGVDFVNFWLGFSQKGNSFAMIQHDEYNFSTGQLVNVRLNSPWYVYYMFQKYFGEQMVATQTTDKEKMSIWAAKDPAQPGKLMVWVTNFTPNPINADVALQNYIASSAEVYELLPDSPLPGLNGNGDIDVYSNLNGKKIDAYNVAGSIAQIQPKKQTIEAGGLNRTFPAYSITAFVLTGEGRPIATLTPTPTPVLTTVPSSTGAPTATIAVHSPTAGPSPTRISNLTSGPSATPFPTISRKWVSQSDTPAACPRRPEGDANCDGFVNLIDHEIFRAEYLGEFIGEGILQADFNSDGKVSLVDVQIWVQTFLNQ